ncbi:uncharacterized protein LOC133783322 [Humulus lupulus]|uniref:uncharacterized protein LOC133783322 n=1 Tax=Humulus lupulus TaxID=3486 RepID=UPI002B40EE3C|nr:uncharacterized protein LOC133783322 [Humulus lupulus]XP_062078904.1 uncharacterized protein LOC133783322 [Humulus lupulus]
MIRKNDDEVEWLEMETMSLILSIINDDILLEILLRLPDFRCIVECAYVCKRWFSFIFGSKAYFSHRFNHYHRQKRLINNNSPTSSPSLPFTLLFTGLSVRTSPFPFEFFSERSKTLDYGRKPALGFLPWTRNDNEYAFLWSSFEDLLLIQLSFKRLYVCNPFLRQYVALPEPNPNNTLFHPRCRYALVVLGRGSDANMIKYKVVKISTEVNNLNSAPPPFHLHLSIFSSETGQWSSSTFEFPVFLHIWSHRSVVVGSNGIVYWPYGVDAIEGVVALNLCSKQCRLIDLPRELGCEWYRSEYRVRAGVVRGRLQLVQLFWSEDKQFYVFKAWELDDDDDGNKVYWNLVHHHDQMSMNFQTCMSSQQLTILAPHPDDRDMFFFSRSININCENKEIFLCRILGQNRNHIESLCHLPPGSPLRLRVVPLLHPWWPTQIPQLRI